MNFSKRILYGISWLTDFTLFLIIFTVSRRLAEEHVSLLVLGVVGAGQAFFAAASSLVFGQLSDRLGRCRLIRWGTGLLFASAVGCMVLEGIRPLYMLCYWLAGASIGLVYPSVIAWLSDVGKVRHHRQATSPLIRFCLAWNLGLICGQFAGGWLFGLWRHMPLLLAAALGLADWVLAWLAGRVPLEPLELEEQEEFEIETQQRALSGAFARLSWIANLGGAYSVSTIFHLFPDLAVSLGVPSSHHGTMLAFMRGLTIATYLLMHRFSFWHHRFSIGLGAQSLAVGGLLVIAFAQSEFALFVGLVGLGILAGYNYFASIYYSTTSAVQKRKGLASGIHEATLGLGMATGSLVGGLVGRVPGSRAPYLLSVCVVAFLAGVQIVLYVWRIHPRRRHGGDLAARS